MNVALPEVDGRILTRAVSFKARGALRRRRPNATSSSLQPVPDRVALRRRRWRPRWARLRATPAAERRVALVLANYPNRDGRIGNGVGLDTPAGDRRDPARAARRPAIAVDDAPDGRRRR